MTASTSVPAYVIFKRDDGDELSIKFQAKVALGWEYKDEVTSNLNG